MEVGQGLEGVIPDITASRLLRSTVQPALRSGTPAVGVHLLLNEIARLSEVNLSTAPVAKHKKKSSSVLFVLFSLLIIVFSRLGSSRSWSSHSQSHLRSGHRWGGGGWGGGGGVGGWGGGGGGFSGGGSSGGW